MPAREILVSGRAQPPVDAVPLRAGKLTLLFDPETISLRRICLDDREVIRGIYGAVRDRNWGSVPPRLQNLNIKAAADSFRVTFEVSCQQTGIDFFWRGEITGKSDCTVRFSFDGEARTTFLRNRIGLCVLHPVRECAGARASFARKNNWQVELAFPQSIEPQILGEAHFTDMRTLAHEIRPGIWAHLNFEGDVFELEDQRNWTDASFKTYGTPLGKPFPIEIKSGTRVSQSVTLSLTKDPTERGGNLRAAPARITARAPDQDAPFELPAEATLRLPDLGLGCRSGDAAGNAEDLRRLAVLGLSHLRVDLRLADPALTRTLVRAAAESRAAVTGLEMALHLPTENAGKHLGALRDALRELAIMPSRILVFRSGQPATDTEVLKQIREELPLDGVPIGGGSDAHFCELNRARALGEFDPSAADFISWPMTPQVHAFDDRSIVETLEAQPHTVTTARAFAEGRPLMISPVTLRPRFNAVATSAENRFATGELPPWVDPRQMSLFAAAWTLGSLAALTGAGVSSATYFETTGWCGVMETSTGSPLPEQFPSIPGAVFPVYFVFAALAGFRRAARLIGAESDSVASLVLFGDAGCRRIVLANLTPRSLTAHLKIGKPDTRGSLLDETNVEDAMRRPERFLANPCRWTTGPDAVLELELHRHAVAWFDLE